MTRSVAADRVSQSQVPSACCCWTMTMARPAPARARMLLLLLVLMAWLAASSSRGGNRGRMLQKLPRHHACVITPDAPCGATGCARECCRLAAAATAAANSAINETPSGLPVRSARRPETDLIFVSRARKPAARPRGRGRRWTARRPRTRMRPRPPFSARAGFRRATLRITGAAEHGKATRSYGGHDDRIAVN